MSSNIPRARELLLDALSQDMDPTARTAVAEALRLMTRASPARRAPVQHRVTKDKKAMIRRIAAMYPHMHVADIAQLADVNPGRVSEALQDDEDV